MCASWLGNSTHGAARPLARTQVLLSPTAASAERWGALDDVVMGGVSSSSLQLQRGAGEDGGDAMVFRWATVCCRSFVRACVRACVRASVASLRPRGRGVCVWR